jgi:hypothetical protein
VAFSIATWDRLIPEKFKNSGIRTILRCRGQVYVQARI